MSDVSFECFIVPGTKLNVCYLFACGYPWLLQTSFGIPGWPFHANLCILQVEPLPSLMGPVPLSPNLLCVRFVLKPISSVFLCKLVLLDPLNLVEFWLRFHAIIGKWGARPVIMPITSFFFHRLVWLDPLNLVECLPRFHAMAWRQGVRPTIMPISGVFYQEPAQLGLPDILMLKIFPLLLLYELKWDFLLWKWTGCNTCHLDFSQSHPCWDEDEGGSCYRSSTLPMTRNPHWKMWTSCCGMVQEWTMPSGSLSILDLLGWRLCGQMWYVPPGLPSLFFPWASSLFATLISSGPADNWLPAGPPDLPSMFIDGPQACHLVGGGAKAWLVQPHPLLLPILPPSLPPCSQLAP